MRCMTPNSHMEVTPATGYDERVTSAKAVAEIYALWKLTTCYVTSQTSGKAYHNYISTVERRETNFEPSRRFRMCLFRNRQPPRAVHFFIPGRSHFGNEKRYLLIYQCTVKVVPVPVVQTMYEGIHANQIEVSFQDVPRNKRSGKIFHTDHLINSHSSRTKNPKLL